MSLRGTRFRSAALLAGGALAVHQLRYLIAYGGHSNEQLASQGHFYLSIVAPIAAIVIMLAGIELALRTAGAERRPPTVVPSMKRLWPSASATLFCVYAGQEWLEGIAAAGHPGGPAAVFGHGGTVAIVLSVLFGGVVSILIRGAASVQAVPARGPAQPRPPRATTALAMPASVVAALDAVASHLAGRGPPQLACT